MNVNRIPCSASAKKNSTRILTSNLRPKQNSTKLDVVAAYIFFAEDTEFQFPSIEFVKNFLFFITRLKPTHRNIIGFSSLHFPSKHSSSQHTHTHTHSCVVGSSTCSYSRALKFACFFLVFSSVLKKNQTIHTR